MITVELLLLTVVGMPAGVIVVAGSVAKGARSKMSKIVAVYVAMK